MVIYASTMFACSYIQARLSSRCHVSNKKLIFEKGEKKIIILLLVHIDFLYSVVVRLVNIFF